MKYDIMNFENNTVGDIELNDSLFNISVRNDILARVIQYQLAKRHRGTHKVKSRGEVDKTGRKMYKQKGTGNARHRDSAAPIFVGGGRAFGPTPRSYEQKLQKKVRVLGLKMALSQKANEKNLKIFDSEILFQKTKDMVKALKICDLNNILFVAPNKDFQQKNFRKVLSNIPNVHVLPVMGLNVYDIFKYKNLAILQDALSVIEERLK